MTRGARFARRAGPRRLSRWALAAVGLVLAAAAPARGGDRTDVPLKPWGAFSLYRHSIYDDLERLAAAGLVDRVLLNTRPLSRTEAARLVARAIDNIRRDSADVWSARRDLEPVVDRLMDELRPELAGLGVRINGVSPRGFVSWVPVDRLQVRGGVSSSDYKFVNSQGLTFRDGVNGGTTFDSRLQIGDFLSFYVQPELRGSEEALQARLETGYAKLTLFNVELAVGRESLWWGPGLHGSLILSNNAPPLDHVRIGSAEAFELPWVGRWIGPTKVLFFVAQLEERREDPRAKLAGMRASIAPFRFFELGASRVAMFGGEKRPSPGPTDVLQILFNPPAGDDAVREPELRTNNLFAIDADLRIANVDRFRLPARDLRLYGEFGWDDTCCGTVLVPLFDAISVTLGAQVLGVFRHDGLDARFEYTRTSRLSYTHTQFRNGYWTRGHALAHFVGTEGEDWYARTTNWLTPNVMLGLELDRAVIGRTAKTLDTPKERRLSGAVDVSWRFAEHYAALVQVQIADVNNRDFRARRDGVEQMLRLELTRTFR